MTIEIITRARAVKLTGHRRLPCGLRWYLVTGIEFYPTYGDWSHMVAGSGGLAVAVIGKRSAGKQVTKEAA